MSLLNSLSNFQQRAIFGLISLAIVITSVRLSHDPNFGPVFLFLLIFTQGLALWEYYDIVEKKGYASLSHVAIIASAAFLCTRYFALFHPHLFFLNMVVLFLFALVSFAILFKRLENSTIVLATTFFGFAYVTFPLSFLLDINFLKSPYTGNNSEVWVFFLIAVTKATDTFAYFIGRKYGTHRFAGELSPKKTVEGALGGLLGAVVVALLFNSLIPSVTWIELSLLGLALGVAAEFGDLAESLLKRDAKIKDSNALPGFGGVLDIVDSMIFTTPLLYSYLISKSLL